MNQNLHSSQTEWPWSVQRQTHEHMTDAVAVTDKAKAIELVSRPTNPKATHIFMGLSGDTYLAGQCVEGVLLVVVNQPVVIQSIGLIVYVLDWPSMCSIQRNSTFVSYPCPSLLFAALSLQCCAIIVVIVFASNCRAIPITFPLALILTTERRDRASPWCSHFHLIFTLAMIVVVICLHLMY